MSDHAQISVYIQCNKSNSEIISSSRALQSNILKCSYKWENISKSKLLDALSDPKVLEQILSYENTNYEQNTQGIDKATEALNSILQDLAMKSCKVINCRKKKAKKKNPWFDNQLRDLKKTVLMLGTKMKNEPFNKKIRCDYFTHCKKMKKMVKQKKHFFEKELYDKLLN